MLTDFHLHSSLSDGTLGVRELIDLHGKLGFGAIAITDHLCEQKTFLGKAAKYLDKTLRPESFKSYLELLHEEAERAWRLYKMVVIPGVEITKNSFINHRSAHILILGISSYIDPDQDIDAILVQAKGQGAVTVAAHPVWTRQLEKQTFHLWDRLEELKNKIDLWEVASGKHIFHEVQSQDLRMVANSDMHTPQHIRSWKTRIDCEHRADVILENLMKQNCDYVFFGESVTEKSVNNIIFNNVRYG